MDEQKYDPMEASKPSVPTPQLTSVAPAHPGAAPTSYVKTFKEEEPEVPTADLSSIPDPGIKLVLHVKNMLYVRTLILSTCILPYTSHSTQRIGKWSQCWLPMEK